MNQQTVAIGPFSLESGPERGTAVSMPAAQARSAAADQLPDRVGDHSPADLIAGRR
jgi:hypothetical protein